MYEYWYDYVKPKYREKANICYMDTDSFIVCVKLDGTLDKFQKTLEQDLALQNMNQTDYYLKEKNRKVITLMKDELNGKIVENIFQLRVKTCSYLKDNRSKYQKTKGTKKCVIKRKIKLKIIKIVSKQLKLKIK